MNYTRTKMWNAWEIRDSSNSWLWVMIMCGFISVCIWLNAFHFNVELLIVHVYFALEIVQQKCSIWGETRKFLITFYYLCRNLNNFSVIAFLWCFYDWSMLYFWVVFEVYTSLKLEIIFFSLSGDEKYYCKFLLDNLNWNLFARKTLSRGRYYKNV